MNSLTNGGELRIPVGVWQARFTLPSAKSIIIKGVNSEPFDNYNSGTRLLSPPGPEPVISGNKIRSIVIDGLRIDCNKQALAGIDINSCFRSQFRNITIRDSKDKGFAVYASQGHPYGGVYYNLFENILVRMCDGPGFYHHADPGYCNSNTWINCSAGRNR